MTWWIRLNGHEEGPFSDDDMRKRIALNMIGSLDRVSTNRQQWRYLKDTELWRPQKKGVGTISPAESPSTAIASTRPVSVPWKAASSSSASVSSAPIPERLRMPKESPPSKPNRTLILAVCGGAAAILVVALIAIAIMVFSRSAEPNKSGFKAVREAVALIECKEGSGTGFLLDMDGKTYLMSNEHVLRSGGKIEARLIDGTLLRLGEFYVAADGRDLARFEVLGCSKKPLRLRDTMPSINEPLALYGNSLGGGVATESKGFVQGVGPTKVETNCEIVRGNSGSPLLDVNNVVVGVAAFMEYTGKKDWGNMGTRYDGKVRRYAVRLNGVSWKAIDRNEYEKQVREFTEFVTFWKYLRPYLWLETGKVPEEDLIYNDLCSKNFSIHETGFNDMLKEISQKYEKSDKAIARLAEWETGRKELIRRLGLEIDSKQLTKDAANKEITEYDEKMIKAYVKMKEECRGMILIRKEALNHARTFLASRTWEVPQIEKGYDDDPSDSVQAYRDEILKCIDVMNQVMKNLNKKLKELEGGNDDEND